MNNIVKLLVKIAIFGSLSTMIACSNDEIIPGKRFDIITVDNNYNIDQKLKNIPVNLIEPSVRYEFTLPFYSRNRDNINNKVNFSQNNQYTWQKYTQYGIGSGSNSKVLFLNQPIIFEDSIYTINNAGRVYRLAISPSNDNVNWNFNSADYLNMDENKSTQGGIAIGEHKSTLYVATGYGYVIALDLKTGKPLWKYNVKTSLRSSPVIYNNTLLILGLNDTLSAIDISSHKLKWQYKSSNMANTTIIRNSNPILYKNSIIATFSSGEVVSFNVNNGQKNWQKQLGFERPSLLAKRNLNTIVASPVINNDVLYIANNHDIFLALNLKSGSVLWNKKIGLLKTPAVFNKWIFAVDNNNNLIAINNLNGNVKWKTSLKNSLEFLQEIDYSAPFAINSTINVITSNGLIATYDKNSGELLNKHNLKINAETNLPIVINNQLYVYSIKGRITVFNPL